MPSPATTGPPASARQTARPPSDQTAACASARALRAYGNGVDPSTNGYHGVFVDPTGRRAASLRWVARLLTAGGTLYFVLLLASFARAPWVPRVSMPGLGALLPPTEPVKSPTLG